MSYIEQNLVKNETIICQAKPHWVLFSRPFFWLLITLLLLIITPNYPWAHFQLLPIMPPVYKVLSFIALCVTLMSALSTYITYWTTEFSITNKRVVMKTGLVRRSTLEILLNRIESISIDQSLFGRLLNYGTLIVSGMGGSKDPFIVLPDPAHLRGIVQEQIEQTSPVVKSYAD